MQQETTVTPIVVRPSGVVVVDGYGIQLQVERGRLTIRDGIGRARSEASFARATCPIRRLVLLGHTGSISLDSIRWMADVGIGFVQLDVDGRLLVASGGLGLDDPRLRRLQAQAFGNEVGMAIAIDLLDAKLEGQARVARRLPGDRGVGAVIESLKPALRLATTPAALLVPEARAADLYWKAWAGVDVNWARRDVSLVPEHWRTFSGRASPLTGKPRTAANPANAILNYLYALLEAEARLACLAMGLDPGLGVLHADLRARDSLALDVIEAVRPDVDAYLLELLGRRAFRRTDFVETRQGGCRLLAPLTHELAETMPYWRGRLAPVVERVAQRLAADHDAAKRPLPTLLTGRRRSASRPWRVELSGTAAKPVLPALDRRDRTQGHSSRAWASA
jgi:CRISPR-associated endonuclease Cas1